jgi:hypothetical protein
MGAWADDPIVSAPAARAPFNANDPVITPVGAGDAGARALAGSGGVLLDALNGLMSIANPTAMVQKAFAQNDLDAARQRAANEEFDKDLPTGSPDAGVTQAKALMDAVDPIGALARRAGAASRIQPNEIPSNEFARAMQEVGGVPGGALEGVENLGSTMLALPAAGAAGLGTLGTNALGLTNTPAADVVGKVNDALTYQPHTEAGQNIAGAAALPFELLAKGGRFAGEHVQDATGSPALATAIDTLIQAAPMLLGARGKGAELPHDAVTPDMVDAFMRDNPAPPALPAPAEAPRGAPASDITDVDFNDLARLMHDGTPPALPAPHAVGADPRALAAPVVDVDRAGNARTSQSFMGELLDQIAQQQARRDLGMTPGTERAISEHETRNADPVVDQRNDDAPPWWLAGQMAELEHDATPARADIPDARTANDLPPPATVPTPDAPQANGGRAATLPGARQWIATGQRDSKGRAITAPTLDYSRDHLVHWLGKNGGVNFDELAAQTGADPALLKDADVMRPFGRVGFSALRRKGGMSLERTRERMQEDGWLSPDDAGTPQHSLTDAADLVHEAINGRDVFHPYEGADARMERAAENSLGLHGVHDVEADDHPELAAQYAERADAARTAVGSDLSPADESDALSLGDLYNHALAVGADPAAVSKAHVGATPAETARTLWDLIREKEGDRAQTRRNEEDSRRGSDGQAATNGLAAEPREAGRSAEEAAGETGQVESPVTGFNSDQDELFARPARAESTEGARAPANDSGDLFGAPTDRDRLANAQREGDAARSGMGGGRAPERGGLFDRREDAPPQTDLAPTPRRADYDRALETFRGEARMWQTARDRFRAGDIDADAFADARGAFHEAETAMDKAERQFRAGGSVEEPNTLQERGSASRDMFTRTRGEADAENGTQPHHAGAPERSVARASKERPSDARPDWTPEVARRGELAVDELVRRHGGSTLADTIAEDFRRAEGSHLVGQVVRTEQDFAAAAYVYRNPAFETLHYVFTDANGRVLAETAVSSRKPSSSAMFPKGTTIEDAVSWLDDAMPEGTAGVWMTHNHPSGDPTPSKADLRGTRQFREILGKTKAKPSLLGHVITNHETYGRITPNGEARPNGAIPRGPDPTRARRGDFIFDKQLNTNSNAAAAAKQIAGQLPKDSVAIITLDANARISFAASIPGKTLATKRGAALISLLGKRRGAGAITLVADGDLIHEHYEALQTASKRGLLFNVVELAPDGSALSLGGGEVESKIFGNHTRSMRKRGGVQVHEDTDALDEVHEEFARGDIGGERPADAPSRRPGESQRDYTRRVMRTGKDEIRAATALAKRQQKIGRANFREMLAKQARAMDIADAAFSEARKTFDQTPEKINLATIDQWETGQPILDSDAKQFFDDMKGAFDQRVARIRELAPDALKELVENYFPHIWEDSARAVKWYQSFMAKRPLEGNKSFLKQRTWGTIKEGMASGLKPVSTNPVDLALLKLSQMDKFIAFHEFRDDLKARGWLKEMEPGARLPEGYARIDDPAFSKAAGLQGYYATPELIAKDVNNYLGPSLYRYGAWKALRTVQNTLVSARLGWSAFHAGFTTLDNLVMHVDVAGRRLLEGDLAGGLTTLLKAPLSIGMSPFEGGTLNKEWRGLKEADPHTSAILHMLEQGGARYKMSATDYNQALQKITRSIRQAIANRNIRSAADVTKHLLPAIGELGSWLIHHKLVPNQKMAARVMLAKFELDRLAGALGTKRGDYAGIIDAMHPDTLKQIAGKVVDVVDDRLGQMTYDNQFWPKMLREVSQAAIGAVGWQVGTLRTVTGGISDLPKLFRPEKLVAPLDKAGTVTDADMGRVSGRLSYLLTLALVMGGLGAVTQYLLTGKWPSEIKDYFFPRTGRRNKDDSEERLQYPSYWMDHYKLATHPIETAKHKLHPSIGMLMEALSNQDYYGTQIRDPDAPWQTQAKQIGEYVAQGFEPYTLNNQSKLAETDSAAGQRAANFIGVTTAPTSVSRSKFQTFVAEKAYDAMPKGARTADQKAHSDRMHDVEDALRRGETPDTSDLAPKDRKSASKAASMQIPEIRFRRLGLEDKIRAWDMATSDERQRYNLRAIILKSNPSKSAVFQRLPDDEKQAVMTRVREIANQPAVIGTADDDENGDE